MGESTSGERTISKIELADKVKYSRLASGVAVLIETVGIMGSTSETAWEASGVAVLIETVGIMGSANETAWEGRGEDIRSEE